MPKQMKLSDNPPDEPTVGPLHKKSLTDYRDCDLIAPRAAADALNAALRHCAQIRVAQKPDHSSPDVSKQRNGQRLLHKGDVVISLEDLSAEQQEIAKNIMAQRQSNVVQVGEILGRKDSDERDLEAVGLIFKILSLRVDKLFEASSVMEQLCTTGGIALPLSFEGPGPFTLENVPLGGDQKYERDEKFRHQRNKWFTEKISGTLCLLLRDDFLSNVVPLWQHGIVYEPSITFKWNESCGHKGFTWTDWHGDTWTQPLEHIRKLDKELGPMLVPRGTVIDQGTGRQTIDSVRFVDVAEKCLAGDISPPKSGTSISTFCEKNLGGYFDPREDRHFSVFLNSDPRVKTQCITYGHHNDIGDAIVLGFLSSDPLDPKNRDYYNFRECPSLGCQIFKDPPEKQCKDAKRIGAKNLSPQGD